MLLWIINKLQRYRSLVVGNITFKGTESFLKICESANQRFSQIDPELHSLILNGKKITLVSSFDSFHCDPIASIIFCRDDFSAYGDFGIISLLLFMHGINIAAAKPTDAAHAKASDTEMYKYAATFVANWGHQFNLPDALVDLFEKWPKRS